MTMQTIKISNGQLSLASELKLILKVEQIEITFRGNPK